MMAISCVIFKGMPVAGDAVKGEYSYQPTLMLPIASKWRMWKK
jgi:hypothetical protein